MTERSAFHIGANCILVREGMVLLGLRAKGSGEGKWALPGGHLEWGERLADCAERELFEETGLVAKEMSYGGVVNDVRVQDSELQHRLHHQFLVTAWEGELENKEPESHREWQWFPLDELPLNLWQPFVDILRGYKEGKMLLDAPRKHLI